MVHVSGGGISADLPIRALIIGFFVMVPLSIKRVYLTKYKYRGGKITLSQVAKKYGPQKKAGIRSVYKWAEQNELIRYMVMAGRTPPGSSLDELLDWRR